MQFCSPTHIPPRCPEKVPALLAELGRVQLQELGVPEEQPLFLFSDDDELLADLTGTRHGGPAIS